MKKLFIITTCYAVLLASCTKDDATPPKFKMNGAATITHSLNAPFNDPDVTAEDNEDGNITVTSDISLTNPDVNHTGHYIITYTATDSEGNTDKITRNVIVVNDAAFMAGAYHTDTDSSTCGLNYTDGIIASTTVNNRIIFNQIGRCTNANKKLMADIDFSTQTVTIVSDVINCGTFPLVVDRLFSGGGALAFNNTVIDLDITETIAGTPVTCRYYFVKQ